MLLPVPNVRGSNLFNSTTLAESDWGAVTSGLSAHHLWCLPASSFRRWASDWHLKIHKYVLQKYNTSKYTNTSCRNKIPIYHQVEIIPPFVFLVGTVGGSWWFEGVWRRGVCPEDCKSKWDGKLIFKPHLLKATVPSFILRGRPEWSNHPRSLMKYKDMRTWKYEDVGIWGYKQLRKWKYKILRFWRYGNVKICGKSYFSSINCSIQSILIKMIQPFPLTSRRCYSHVFKIDLIGAFILSLYSLNLTSCLMFLAIYVLHCTHTGVLVNTLCDICCGNSSFKIFNINFVQHMRLPTKANNVNL